VRRDDRGLTPGFVLVNTVLLWLAMAVASVTLWPIYQSPALLVMLVVTTVVGSALAVLGAVFRWPGIVMLAATLAAFLLLGVPLAVPGLALYGVLPTVDGLVQLVSGAALGWKQLLTITLPVGSYQALLVPAFLLVLLVSVCSLSAALRSRRGSLAAIGPVLLFLAGLSLGPEFATWPLPVSLALFTAVFVWLMWRRWYARRSAIRVLAAEARSTDGTQAVVPSEHRLFGARTVVAAALILAIAGGAGAVAVAVVPPSVPREVLRSTLVQPFEPRDYASPLAGFRRYLQPDLAETVLFTVTGLPAGAGIRIATLDSYDGIVYSVGSAEVASASGSFTRVPYRFNQSAVSGERVSIDVTVGDYDGVWLPTIGQLEDVQFEGADASALRDSFYYNDTAATAAVVGGLSAGDEYRLDAVLPTQPDDAELSALSPGTAVVPPVAVLPEETEIVLDRYVDGVEGPGRRLAAMLAGLRADGYISHGIGDDEPPSRSGHFADRITELLSDQRMIGDAEQYAVTAALMAGQLGFPARVVFGFAPETAVGGTAEVTGGDVTAWIEVDTEQFGWVALDPNPPVREIPDELPEEPTTVSRPQSIVPPPVVEPEQPDTQTPQESTQDEPAELPGWLQIALVVLRVLGIAALAAAVLASPFLVVIGAKLARRRRRRRAPSPLARISGGWQEYRDAVVDHGLEPAPTATRRELAATVGGQPASILAAISDRAMFAPVEPSDADADRVWRAVRDLSAQLDAGTTRWQRFKARISLRSLGSLSGRGRDTRRGDRQGASS
jgi:hypothetical protein